MLDQKFEFQSFNILDIVFFAFHLVYHLTALLYGNETGIQSDESQYSVINNQ